MSRFRHINERQMHNMLANDMGFERVDIKDCWEHVYERDVVTKSGNKFPYKVRVYTSIDRNTGRTRGCGEDSIRVQLIDRVTNLPIKDGTARRVHRTKNALSNMRERAREVFKYAMSAPKCNTCNGIMVPRKNGTTGHKFLGCSRYNPIAVYHCDRTARLKETA